ncbi:DUF1178 family protein [Histidinibacterium aquaticum]|uniref:DUF1178 family protein n=1 Tax=Histidinibacterium aquaticum TaxID=2613962 RepID=A0A5J5GRM5_9RHOB|nr:DUF1178 family protein [Histidinibacterium aquaticum]KAA9010194.1 DUF1178 family protein [Histidinibacterium aquaticum]
MIRYALKCSGGHSFDSWFQSAAAYDRLAEAGHVACSVCGSSEVGKELMSPGVSAREEREPARPAADRPLATPSTPIEKAMAALRRKVETESTYVGNRFAEEARKMHEGETPQASIYGEARLADAKQLIEDGVPVCPLPFTPRRSSN